MMSKNLKREGTEQETQIIYHVKNPRLFNYKKHELQLGASALKKQSVKKIKANKWCDSFELDSSKYYHMKELLLAIKSSKQIKTLNLNFSRMKEWSQSDLFSERWLRKFKWTARHFQKVIEALKGLSSLQKIVLNFSGCELENSGLLKLGECLRRLPSLKSVCFDFSKCSGFYDPGSIQLFESLAWLPSLENLKLSFQACDKELQNLSYILKKISSLKRLIIQAPFCDQVTNPGLIRFSRSLKGLQSLQTLHYDFKKRDDPFCSRGEESLIGALNTLPSLQALKLNFDQ